MTYRAQLEQKIRHGLKYLFAGMMLVLLGLFIIEGSLGQIVGLIGILISAAGGLYLFRHVRCPKCRAPIDLTNLSSAYRLPRTYQVNYCAHCGFKLDTEQML